MMDERKSTTKTEYESFSTASPIRRARLAILVASITVSLLAVLLLLAVTGTPSGYEDSLYDSIPTVFWIILVALYFINAVSLTLGFRRRVEATALTKVSLLGLWALSGIFIAIPILRYSTIYTQGDIWHHLSWTLDIIQSRSVDLQANSYPAVHILLAKTHLIGALSPFDSANLLIVLFASLKVPLIYAFAKNVCSDGRILGLAVSTSAIVDYALFYFIMPWSLSLVIVLGLFYGYSKPRTKTAVPSRLLILVFIVALAAAHPFISLVLGSLMLGGAGFRAAVTRLPRYDAAQERMINIGVVALATTVAWAVLVTSAYADPIRLIAAVFQTGTPVPESYGENFRLDLIVRVFATKFLLVVPLSAGLVVVTSRALRMSDHYSRLVTLSLFPLFLGFVFFMQQLVVSDLPVAAERLIAFAFFPGGLWIAYGFLEGFRVPRHRESQHDRSAHSRAIAALAILLVAFAVGSQTAYPSGLVQLANGQNSESEYSGMNWYQHYRSLETQGIGMIHLVRYSTFLASSTGDQGAQLSSRSLLPSHLGYEGRSSTLALLERAYYLLDEQTIRLGSVPNRNIPLGWELNPSDIGMLNTDLRAARLYDNGQFWIFYVSQAYAADYGGY